MAHSSANSVLQRELLDTIKGLRATIESLQSTIEDLRKSLAESQERERLAKEQIEVMTKRFFGRSSEKHMVQSDGQLDFFNDYAARQKQKSLDDAVDQIRNRFGVNAVRNASLMEVPGMAQDKCETVPMPGPMYR